MVQSKDDALLSHTVLLGAHIARHPDGVLRR